MNRTILIVALLAVTMTATASAQQMNTVYASFGIDVNAEDVVGQGPTDVEYWTDSEVAFESKGLPFQFVAVLVGEYFPEAFAAGPLVVDIHLPTISVLMNGFTSLDPAESTGPTGVAGRTLIFPGIEQPADQTAAMQAVIGDPTSVFGIRTTAACRMTLRSGYQAIEMSDDGSVYVPFLGGFTFPFYGADQPGVWVSANGFVTSESELFEHEASILPFLSGPARIAAFFTDLGPHLAVDETISFSQFKVGEEWRARVRWDRVPGVGDPALRHSAEIVMQELGVFSIFIDGDCDAAATDILVGVTPGLNIDPTAQPVDLSALKGTFQYAGPDHAVFELFDHSSLPGPANFIDLNGTELFFFPDFATGVPIGYSVY